MAAENGLSDSDENDIFLRQRYSERKKHRIKAIFSCTDWYVDQRNLLNVAVFQIRSPLKILTHSSCLIFYRQISQKCSSIHRVLTPPFVTFDEKIHLRSERVEYSEVPISKTGAIMKYQYQTKGVCFLMLLMNMQGSA